jgi:hypothetical protein
MSPQRKTQLAIAVLGLIALSVETDLAQAQTRVYGYNGAASRYSLMATATSRSRGHSNSGYFNGRLLSARDLQANRNGARASRHRPNTVKGNANYVAQTQETFKKESNGLATKKESAAGWVPIHHNVWRANQMF